MEEVPRRTSLVPLAFPCFVLCLIGVETEGLLDYQGRAGDHFHCTVEPSPGHIRCRLLTPLCVFWPYAAEMLKGPCVTRRPFPEGPARHLDASRQKVTPHCLAAIFDSQFNLPSPKLSLKMPPKLPLPHNTGHFFLFQIAPVVRVIARQLSGKNCLAAISASRHQDASPGPLGLGWR